MDRLQQYLRETRDAGRLPNEVEFERFKTGSADPSTTHPLAHHAHYRGADGRPFTIASPAEADARRRREAEAANARRA